MSNPLIVSRRQTVVVNEHGLHARPSAAIAAEAAKHNCTVTISNGSRDASALSISAMLMLEAHRGTMLALRSEGTGSEDALDAISAIIGGGFGEKHLEISGSGNNCGLAMGPAHMQPKSRNIPCYKIAKESAAAEKRRLSAAIRKVRAEFEKLGEGESSEAEIMPFRTLLLTILRDDHITRLPKEMISEELVNAEWAVSTSINQLVKQFEKNTDDLLRTRCDEYMQVMIRIVRALGKSPRRGKRLSTVRNKVVLADNLGPADVVELHRAGYRGFVTASGGINSHAAILAKGLGIPALVGIGDDILQRIVENDYLIIDSDNSLLLVNPERAKRMQYQNRVKTKTRSRCLRSTHGGTRALTRDGERITLMANIDFPDEIPHALEVGAEGIGLFRTEYLYLDRSDDPDEDEQYQHYRKVLTMMGNLPVTFRTMDLGYDKVSRKLSMSGSPLGLRALRYCLSKPYIFKRQLRALLRSSVHGNMQIMLPMVSAVHELEQVLALLAEAHRELGPNAPEMPPLGAMIEIPGSVFIMRGMDKHLNFYSIGTNDLIQYTLALDRSDANISHLADVCHPGVLALIGSIVKQAVELGKPVTMCGEAATDLRIARLFASMGLRSLSMIASRIPAVREGLHETSLIKISKQAGKVMSARTTGEVCSVLGAMRIN